jgi:hypothetical protein
MTMLGALLVRLPFQVMEAMPIVSSTVHAAVVEVVDVGAVEMFDVLSSSGYDSFSILPYCSGLCMFCSYSS